MAKYAITFFVFSVLPAPDSPLGVEGYHFVSVYIDDCRGHAHNFVLSIFHVFQLNHRLIFSVHKINIKYLLFSLFLHTSGTVISINFTFLKFVIFMSEDLQFYASGICAYFIFALF